MEKERIAILRREENSIFIQLFNGETNDITLYPGPKGSPELTSALLDEVFKSLVFVLSGIMKEKIIEFHSKAKEKLH